MRLKSAPAVARIRCLALPEVSTFEVFASLASQASCRQAATWRVSREREPRRLAIRTSLLEVDDRSSRVFASAASLSPNSPLVGGSACWGWVILRR